MKVGLQREFDVLKPLLLVIAYYVCISGQKSVPGCWVKLHSQAALVALRSPPQLILYRLVGPDSGCL